ncbi:MAG: PIN domain-containing protein [Oscillospiraceae bacterium]|jgi:predicted nucleic acid-binding protein|nr:PIN domain-containing protein [Oscillospiraceae bacterium]
MKLYLDSCCYNRPYDDQTQERIHLEAEAVLAIISKTKENNDEIIGSAALDFELQQITDNEKQEKVEDFYEQAIDRKVEYSNAIFERVKELSKQTNIRTLDRFHLCFAENAGVDILLTTDDKFEKACLKLNLNMKIINPLDFLMEAIRNEYNN